MNKHVPLAGEYSPAFEGYVSRARGTVDLVERLGEQLKELRALLVPLDSARQLHRYAEGKWSVKELLGHMSDAERIFSYRLLRVARADQTPLPGFDENLYVVSAEFDRCDWDELLEEFGNVRYASIHLVRHLPDAAWTRTGISNNHAISVRALAHIMIGHVDHHLAMIRERYS